MPVLTRPFTAIAQVAMQPAGVRVLMLVLAVLGLLLNSGMMAPPALAALAMSPAGQEMTAGSDRMPCCDHAETGWEQGAAKGGLKAGLMNCPVACGGWPETAVALPLPLMQAQRMVPPPQDWPDGLPAVPADRPPRSGA